MAGRKELVWSYTYLDLAKITSKTANAVQAAASRGKSGRASGFDPADFESVICWVFRNAPEQLRYKLLREMAFFRTDKGLERVSKKPGKKQPGK